MAKKSDEEEEDKNKPKKKVRGSDLWHIWKEEMMERTGLKKGE